MKELSPRQQQVYDFIEKYQNANGFSPSQADIAEGLGLSVPTIHTYIGAIKRKGGVTNQPGVPRSLRAVRKALL